MDDRLLVADAGERSGAKN